MNKPTYDELEALSERLKQEAKNHASEARGANATIHEIYQLITGATGEPANWNGSKPVKEYIEKMEAQLEATNQRYLQVSGQTCRAEDLAEELQKQFADAQKDAWQPIETAPKDGTEILVLFRRIGVKCVAWTTRWNDPTDEHAHWHIDDNKHDPYPLRGYNEEDELGWMPLPKPPVMQPKEQTT